MLRWEFTSRGDDPTTWVHRVELLNPDGTWGAPRALTHEDFRKEYPQISLRQTEETTPP